MKLTLFVLVLGIGFVSAEPSNQPIAKQAALNAITAFRIDPTSLRGRAAAAIIVEFTEKSSEVAVTISPKAVPFVKADKKDSDRERRTLLAAFIVVNIDAQLFRGEK